MARHGENLTDDSSAEDLDGIRIGFLAEEDVFDRRALWRLASWGVAAVCAVTIGVFANQSYTHTRRDHSTAIDLARQSEQPQTAARENRNELKRLSAAVDTLNADRDRLYARTTSLEQGLESATGSIARQTASAAAAKAATAKAVIPSSPMATATPNDPKPLPSNPAKAPEPTQVASTAPPALSQPAVSVPANPATFEPAQSESEAPLSTTVATPAQPVATPAMAATKIKTNSPAATGSESQAAPETKIELTPADPEATGSITAEPEPPTAEVAVPRTLFGVDLGAATSIDGLRAAWRRITALHQTELTDLRPVIALRERKGSAMPQLRLVAGPLDDAAAAAKICVALAASHRACETTTFDGQRLAITAEPTPAARPSHRRATPRRTQRETSASRPAQPSVSPTPTPAR